ncbi:hypothetical protein [Pelagibacterium halotolerans]|uniref:hypothetical protein n=1 Tax=Pelagibacterium halotolerans TaxID=531813 RepID=UPI00384BF58F
MHQRFGCSGSFHLAVLDEDEVQAVDLVGHVEVVDRLIEADDIAFLRELHGDPDPLELPPEREPSRRSRRAHARADHGLVDGAAILGRRPALGQKPDLAGHILVTEFCDVDFFEQDASASLWNSLNVVQTGDVRPVNNAIWNTAGGDIAANLRLDDIIEIYGLDVE